MFTSIGDNNHSGPIREGRSSRLVEPEEMPPLLWVVSPAADNVNGYRFDAHLWDRHRPLAEAAQRADRPAGFEMHQQSFRRLRGAVIPRENQFAAGRHSVFSRGAPNAEDTRSMVHSHVVLRIS